jgi:membrane protease YdiL (CAAX protease family)
MNSTLPNPPGFWRTVRILLIAKRARAVGRQKRQGELLRQRTGRQGSGLGSFGFVLAILFMAGLNIAAAFTLRTAVLAGQRLEKEREGKIVVSTLFLNQLESAKNAAGGRYSPPEDSPSYSVTHSYDLYSVEAKRIAEQYGGQAEQIDKRLREAVRDHGIRDFVNADDLPQFDALARAGLAPAMLGSLVLLWWAAMLVFQGEGLELDLQRSSHPMWEWLFSHPVRPGAVFLAEMLSPIAANPVYWGAPLFVMFLYGFVYPFELALLAGVLIGVPVAIAAACLGKALEIAIMLRFSRRTRGALIGLMSWLGYTSMILLFFGLAYLPKIVTAIWKLLSYLLVLPWPWLKVFLGAGSDGSFSFLAGLLACWAGSALAIAIGVRVTVWGAQQGLSGNLSRADSGSSVSRRKQTRFKGDPLYRKEFLWFVRDRSAIVQVILIPLTVAAVQLFNFRHVLSYAQGAWNYLCGVAILFGTYFLWILGPKSLSSEGPALWIALTWPRGLEELLKAKAWLWSWISSGMVLVVLGYAAYLFPADMWKIGLVAVGWFFFARSMAEKSVTLVTVTSASEERPPIPWGRRWAAQLGMLTFAIGVLEQQWHLAVIGIVYSFITAAAMWQNFRARLPFLYDPWSEKIPPPPTLMHAMVAISILIEAGAVIGGIFAALAGRENLGIALAVTYGFCSVVVCLGTSSFLRDRGVHARDIWRWRPEPATEENQSVLSLPQRSLAASLPWLMGAAGGLALGLFAHGYLAVLSHFPATAEIIHKSQELMTQIPNLRIFYGIMAIGFAPFAEEYLFRGLLFRSLDREWGSWRAVLGSGAFFAIYHPVLSWLPVALLGMMAAILFKKTGRLGAPVVLHMVYNLIVFL